MKKLLQKIGAVILCACMLMPMCPEEAFAATISYVDITVESPLVGTGHRVVEVSVPNGSAYSATALTTNWIDSAGLSEATEFRDGFEYSCQVKIEQTGSDTFGPTTIVRVNGEAESCNIVDTDNGNYGYITIEYTTMPQVLGTVDTVELMGVPTGAIGDRAEAYNYDGTNYTATGIWTVYNPTTQMYDAMQNTDVFQQGCTYRLEVIATPKIGYVFDEETQLKIGEENTSNDGRNDFLMNKMIYVSHAEEIEEINMLSANYPKAEIGETFTDTELDIAVPEGSHYKASGHWVYMDENWNEFTEGTFESGKVYYLRISIAPEDGYVFAQEASLYVDDEYYGVPSTPTSIQYAERVSFKPVIDKVTLLNLPTATVGGSAKIGEFDVEVPADANYTATARWFASDGNVLAEPVFKDGKRYVLEVFIEANAGYDLAETLYINAYGVDHKKSYVDPEYTWFYKDFSFLKEIPSVEITGYTEPKVGDSAADNLAALKIPADANYEIIAEWEDYIAESAEVVTTFEKGKDYALYISVVPKEGYEFTRSTTATLNGNKVSVDFGDTELRIIEIVTFRELITEVQLSDVPTMEIGKTATTDVKVPDGAKYTAEVFWQVWDDAKAEWIEFNGTFETGKVYTRDVFVFPSNGYRFSEEDTILKVDGEEYKDADIWSDRICFTEFFQTEHKVIERIELTIEEPVVGNHASIAPVITIVGDANYTIIEDFVHWLEGSEDDSYQYDEYFVADKTYGVHFGLRADVGYVFSDDLVIVVNGKVLPDDAYDILSKKLFIDYFYGMGTEEVIEDETEETNKVTDEAIKAPKTGDAANIGIYVCVLLVGMLTFANTLVSKKTKC